MKNNRIHRLSESIDSSISKTYNLSKIEEDPKEIEEDQVPYKKPLIQMTPKSKHSTSLPPIIKDLENEHFSYTFDFFSSLKSHPTIYKFLTEEAIKSRILKKLKLFASPYSIKSKQDSVLKTHRLNIPEELTFDTNFIEEVITTPQAKLIHSESKSRETSRKLSSKDSLNATGLSLKNIIKLPTLDKNSNNLFEKFKTVTGSAENNHKDYKLTWDSYKEYLNLRYPAEMTDIMLKFLYKFKQ